jgi:hypothetical protein
MHSIDSALVIERNLELLEAWNAHFRREGRRHSSSNH